MLLDSLQDTPLIVLLRVNVTLNAHLGVYLSCSILNSFWDVSLLRDTWEVN